jgi:hypothetical protein
MVLQCINLFPIDCWTFRGYIGAPWEEYQMAFESRLCSHYRRIAGETL